MSAYVDLTPVTSSNVAAAVYDEAAGELVVLYGGGETWAYRVSAARAAEFFAAPSQGTWLWDNVRVRGPGNAKRHRVPARKVG